MDLNYSYSFLSFAVGTLSGFQFVAEKHRKSPFRAAWTRAGFVYLAIRGLIASIAFLALYASSVVEKRLLVWALVTGASAELILRTKIFVREKPNPKGGVEEIMLGPLNLLVFFQNFFLARIEEELTPLELKQKIAKAKQKIEFLKVNLPSGTFEEFCQTVERNLEAFEPGSIVDEIHAEVELLGTAYVEGFESENKASSYDDEFKYELAYRILHLLEEEGFLILVS